MAAFALSAPVAAQAGDLEDAVSALRGISTLQASFVQTDRNGRSAGGTLTMKRPGRIRFQYAPGIPMLIVSDGAALTFVDYEARQVQRWPIKNSPLGALLDPSRDVAKFGTLMSNDPARVVIQVRDRGHPEYGTITLRFARKGGAPGGMELQGWTSVDSQNKQTSIALSNHRYGVGVSDAMFKYNDPRRPARR
ncbi:MAG: LolA family protein [Novosphingobium sp.]